MKKELSLILFIIHSEIIVMQFYIFNIYNKTGSYFVRQPISWHRCLTVCWRVIVQNYFACPTRSTTRGTQWLIYTFPTWLTRKIQQREDIHAIPPVFQDRDHFQWIRGGQHSLLDDLRRTYLMTSELPVTLL